MVMRKELKKNRFTRNVQVETEEKGNHAWPGWMEDDLKSLVAQRWKSKASDNQERRKIVQEAQVLKGLRAQYLVSFSQVYVILLN